MSSKYMLVVDFRCEVSILSLFKSGTIMMTRVKNQEISSFLTFASVVFIPLIKRLINGSLHISDLLPIKDDLPAVSDVIINQENTTNDCKQCGTEFTSQDKLRTHTKSFGIFGISVFCFGNRLLPSRSLSELFGICRNKLRYRSRSVNGLSKSVLSMAWLNSR